MPKHTWTLEVPDWTKSNPRTLEIIHSKANEAFGYTHDESARITARAFTFISILTPVVYFVIGYLGSNALSESPDASPAMLAVMAVISIPAIFSLAASAWIIFPKLFMLPGREPKNLALPEFVQHDSYTSDQQYIAILTSEINELQMNITYNRASNARRLLVLKIVIGVVLSSVTIAMLILLAATVI